MTIKFYLVFLFSILLTACNSGTAAPESLRAQKTNLNTQEEQLQSLVKGINDPKLQTVVIEVINITTQNHSEYLMTIASSLESKIAELKNKITIQDEIDEDRQKLNLFLNGEYPEAQHGFRISFNYNNHKAILLRDFTERSQAELLKGLELQEQQVQVSLAALKPMESDLAKLKQIIAIMES